MRLTGSTCPSLHDTPAGAHPAKGKAAEFEADAAAAVIQVRAHRVPAAAVQDLPRFAAEGIDERRRYLLRVVERRVVIEVAVSVALLSLGLYIKINIRRGKR